MAELKECFVIAPIGDEESETRKRSDKILDYIIVPAVAECGYKATRADKISEPGMITSQVIQHIVDDPLVIADLTGRNPNVFYELAIRHALRKPFIQIIEKGEQIPFDVAGTRTIYVNHQDLASAEEAKKAIVAQINSLEADSSKLETPISVSLDLQFLRRSDDPEQRSLADVLSVVTEVRNTVVGLKEKLDVPQLIIKRSSDSDVTDYWGQHKNIYKDLWASHYKSDYLKGHDCKYVIYGEDMLQCKNTEEIAKKDEQIKAMKKQIAELKKGTKKAKE